MDKWDYRLKDSFRLILFWGNIGELLGRNLNRGYDKDFFGRGKWRMKRLAFNFEFWGFLFIEEDWEGLIEEWDGVESCDYLEVKGRDRLEKEGMVYVV